MHLRSRSRFQRRRNSPTGAAAATGQQKAGKAGIIVPFHGISPPGIGPLSGPGRSQGGKRYKVNGLRVLFVVLQRDLHGGGLCAGGAAPQHLRGRGAVGHGIDGNDVAVGVKGEHIPFGAAGVGGDVEGAEQLLALVHGHVASDLDSSEEEELSRLV